MLFTVRDASPKSLKVLLKVVPSIELGARQGGQNLEVDLCLQMPLEIIIGGETLGACSALVAIVGKSICLIEMPL